MKKIRLWTLGSLEHRIVPTKYAIENLEKKIKEVVGEEEGVVNFVWGPDLEVKMIDLSDEPLKITFDESLVYKIPSYLSKLKKDIEEDVNNRVKKLLTSEQIAGYVSIMEEG